MDLYLVRHAIAFERDALRWPDDRDRPLTPAGIERFEQAARGLEALIRHVDVVLSSSYARAWQTAKLLEDCLGWPEPVRSARLEPGHSPDAVLEDLERQTPRSSIVLVGHEPLLSMLASLLLAGNPLELSLDFKKGGAVCLGFRGAARPGDATLHWWLTPKALRKLGRSDR